MVGLDENLSLPLLFPVKVNNKVLAHKVVYPYKFDIYYIYQYPVAVLHKGVLVVRSDYWNLPLVDYKAMQDAILSELSPEYAVTKSLLTVFSYVNMQVVTEEGFDAKLTEIFTDTGMHVVGPNRIQPSTNNKRKVQI